jgi:hypothetical protein
VGTGEIVHMELDAIDWSSESVENHSKHTLHLDISNHTFPVRSKSEKPLPNIFVPAILDQFFIYSLESEQYPPRRQG